jgi:undecaprenyl-diphosphatase
MIGNNKDSIAKFSFLMVLIPVIGANLMELASGAGITENISWGVVLIGFVSAFISGFLACKWMISLVRKSKLIWFSAYCVIIGLVTILLG